jgi:hypothetical protein
MTSRLVPGAHLAALAIEHGLTLHSTGGDFARFPGLKREIPLAAWNRDALDARSLGQPRGLARELTLIRHSPVAYGLQQNRDRIDPARRGLHLTPSGVKKTSLDPVWGLLAHRL